MKKIWENNSLYAFFRPYIEWATRTSYSKITIKGLENIPDAKDVSVIIASNHCNTMMDALVILQSRKAPTFFVARADIFEKPFFAALLHFFKILPIYRKRDGDNSSEKNRVIFEAIVDNLNHGMAFNISPEGTHRTRRSLLPIKKGVFHIAQQAKESAPDREVVIVPAGLEYDDYFNNMTPVTLSFGEPVRIEGDEDPDELSVLLHDRIAGLITYFPDDDKLEENEKAFEERRAPHFSVIHWLWAFALLPAFLVTGFLCCPMLIATALFAKNLKDRAWLNTIRFSTKLGLLPFTVAGAAIGGFIHLPWIAAIALILLTLYSHPLFYLILVFYKKLLKI